MKTAMQTVGKRKTAIARATIKEGQGIVRINSIKIESYQPEIVKLIIQEPIILAGDKISTVNIDVNANGGGQLSQAQAIRTSIANAIVQYFKDEKLREAYLAYDRHMLVSDTRRKEQNKPYRSAPRAKRQKSKR